MNKRKKLFTLWIFITIIFGLVACNQQNPDLENDSASNAGKLNMVATTTIVGDIVSQVGGDRINLSVLLPIGADPHSFDPTPQDIAKVAEADLIFANGLGLEEFLDPLLESAGADDKIVHVSEGIDFLTLESQETDHVAEDQDHDHRGVDPHTWTNPNNVIVWARNIELALSEFDPQNAATYASNADTYITELEILDNWMREQTAQVPAENRKLVTDHALFGYFADQYEFEQVGALIPGYSTLAEPTAQELAAIEDAIHELKVKAIFVGNTINPALAERVAEDSGTQLVFVYTGSLSEPDDGAHTYLDYMRYNTGAFVEALK